jgi:hypothetical protein
MVINGTQATADCFRWYLAPLWAAPDTRRLPMVAGSQAKRSATVRSVPRPPPTAPTAFRPTPPSHGNVSPGQMVGTATEVWEVPLYRQNHPSHHSRERRSETTED